MTLSENCTHSALLAAMVSSTDDFDFHYAW